MSSDENSRAGKKKKKTSASLQSPKLNLKIRKKRLNQCMSTEA
jgi:hypothetical protein